MQQKQLRTEVNIRPWELLNALTSREYLVAFSSYDILKIYVCENIEILSYLDIDGYTRVGWTQTQLVYSKKNFPKHNYS